jgi:hypothetical protein
MAKNTRYLGISGVVVVWADEASNRKECKQRKIEQGTKQ